MNIKKFEDLSQTEKDLWNDFAKKFEVTLSVIKKVSMGCPNCKYKPKGWQDFEFHFSSTHGIHRDMLMDYILP